MILPVADKNMPRRRHALARADSYEVEETPWGRLVWMVAGRFGNSETMTVGRCDINTGMASRRSEFPDRWVIGGHVSPEPRGDGNGVRARGRDGASGARSGSHNCALCGRR
jgi:hypothetical protein